jgi:hypothetical protein
MIEPGVPGDSECNFHTSAVSSSRMTSKSFTDRPINKLFLFDVGDTLAPVAGRDHRASDTVSLKLIL